MKKTKWIKFAKLFAFLTLIGAVSYVCLDLYASKKLAAAYSKLESNGQPMTYDEVIPEPLPDYNNAVLPFDMGMLRLKSEPAPEGNLLDYTSALSADLLKDELDQEDRAELISILASEPISESFMYLQEAASKERFFRPLDYAKGPDLELPHLMDHREASRIVSAAAILAAESGDADKAWKLLTTALAIANQRYDEPLIVTQLVRIACMRIVLEAMQQVSVLVPPSQVQVSAIDRILSSTDQRKAMALAIDGERIMFSEWIFNTSNAEYFNAIKLTNGSEDSQGILIKMRNLAIGVIRMPPFKKLDHAAYLNIVGKSARSVSEPYDPIADSSAEVKRIRELPFYCIATRACVPALSKVKLQAINLEASSNLARIALKSFDLKLDSESLIGAIENIELYDELQDPFVNEPFRIKSEQDSILLYSVGENQVDDGGAPASDDIVWRLSKQ